MAEISLEAVRLKSFEGFFRSFKSDVKLKFCKGVGVCLILQSGMGM